MLRRKPLEPRNELRTRTCDELRLDLILDREQAPLLEPRRLRTRERLVEDVGERRPPPQTERRHKRLPGGPRLALRELLARTADEALEPVDVELVRLDPQHVSRRLPAQPVLPDSAPQPGDVAVERLVDAGRRPLAPQRLDQAVARDRLVRVQTQHRQKTALLRPAERKRLAVAPDLDRTKDAELHRASKAPRQAVFQISARRLSRALRVKSRERKEPPCARLVQASFSPSSRS